MAAKHKRRNLQRDVDEAVRLSDKTLGATSRPGSSLESPLPPTTSISGFKPSSYMAPGGRTTMVPGVDPSVDRVAWAPYRPTQEPPPDQYPGFDPREKRFGSGSWGASGTPITAGYLLDLGEYNPAVYGRQAVLQYEKMRRGDAQVWATLTTPKQVLLSAEWDVIPGIKPDKPGYAKAKEVAEFAKENLFGGLEFETSSGGVHSQAFFSVVRNAMLMLDFGCSAHEDVWHLDGEYIRLRALPARLPITFYRWHTEVDGETLTGLEQYGYRGWEFVNLTLPMNKACFFSYNQEGANFWGIALSRIMYPHWYIASNLYRIDAISSERNGVGLPVITLNEGFSAQDKSNAFDFVTKLAAHELAGLVLPPKSEFRLVGVTGSTHDVMKGIEHHKRQMSIAALQHFLTVGTAPHGSRATAAVQHNFFMQAVEHLAEHICATLTHATLRRLCRYNFGEDAVVPKLLAKNLKSSDITDILSQLVSMAGSGLIVSEKNIRDYLRQELELPVESTEGIIAPKGETIEPITEEATSPITGQKGGKIGGVSQPKPNGQGGPNLAGKGVAATEIRRHLWLDEQKDVKLIVARHGETDDDSDEDDEVMSGWSDIALNEHGRKQAEELAEKLKDKGIVAIRSSPLQRTMETANAVSYALGIPVTQDAGLRSMNFGRHLDGASVNGNKHELQACLGNKDYRLAPDSETRGEFMENFRGAVERASEQSIKMNGPVLIVTHSWNTRAVPLVLAGKLETDHKKPMKPGEVESIEHEAGGWKAVQLSTRRVRSKEVMHLDLDEARRSVDHGRDKLAALLTGSDKARLIRGIARQTVMQLRRGVPVAELRYTSPPDLAHKILPHVKQLFAQAKEQAKRETEKLVGHKRH